MSVLYVVGTPVGNLSDISQRALDTLKSVDYILCEDTRVSQKMLTRFGIKKPMISYHQHSNLDKVDYILGLLADGKNLALISDAGTPGISDPGSQLVREVIKSLSDQVRIEPIPGPSALTAMASVCGFSMDKFIFLGFPPIKKKRQQFFEEIINSKHPVIFFESPYRIIKTLEELSVAGRADLLPKLEPEPLGGLPSFNSLSLQVVVGRELTKKFETIYRGSLNEVIEAIKKSPLKGEFVIAINK